MKLGQEGFVELECARLVMDALNRARGCQAERRATVRSGISQHDMVVVVAEFAWQILADISSSS